MATLKTILRKHTNRRLYSALSGMRRTLQRPQDPSAELATRLAELALLGEPFASTLRSMYRGDPQTGLDGQAHSLDPNVRISVYKGLCLQSLCHEQQARHTLEVGCAYGFSTLYFLSAIRSQEGGRHIAIDAYQNKHWHGIGARNASAVGMDDAFRLIEELSIVALPRLLAEGLSFDVIFIDGNHLFDGVLVDFILSAPLCKPGGCIVFDDLWMPSIRKAISFVRHNRKDFTELPTFTEDTAVFRRTADDQREWTHFQDF